jgi:hypothetical protein
MLGGGGNGSTGLNTTANTSSPTQVGGTDWSSIGRGSQGEQNAAHKTRRNFVDLG